MFTEVTKYAPRKTFREVVLPYPDLGDYRLYNYTSLDARNHWLGINLPEGYIHQLGYEHITTAVNAALTYQYIDGDGIYGTASCTATVPTGTQSSEVCCVFSRGDYLYTDGMEIPPRLS